MLVIISPDSVGAQNVEKEWQEFVSDKTKTVIPVLWRRVEKIPAALERLQYINFDSQHYQIAREILLTTLNVHDVVRIGSGLKIRDEHPSVHELSRHAREISILAVSNGSFSDRGHYGGFLEDKIKRDDCKIKMIIISDNDFALQNWAALSDGDVSATKIGIKDINIVIRRIEKNQKMRRKFQVRTVDFHFPFNLFGVNLSLNDDTSLILIGYYAFGKTRGRERPHLLLTKRDDPEWFEFYRQQFNAAWDTAKIYHPKEEESPTPADGAQSRSEPDQSPPA
jgi:hypothetical protein